MEAEKLIAILKRDTLRMVSEEELLEKLKSGRSLKVKLGADPSRPDLHLGHSVVLRKMRLLQDEGHEIIFVIGDFTGMIGDPSGRSNTRRPLTFEETRENGRTYFEQVTKILDADRTRIVYNSQWLGAMNFAQVLELAQKYTLARILERDDFATRYGQNAAIGLHELFYPLMQGYDSVALDIDIEVGGSDQTFNLLVGRELQRDYGKPPQCVLTFPLLRGLDGVEKMSKSLGNYIGIDEPAAAMYEKCMKVPDGLLEEYFHLTTDLSYESVRKRTGDDVRKAHFCYADTITALYHGSGAAETAKARYLEVAAGNVPADIPVVQMPRGAALVDAVKAAGFATSNSQARRLIEGRGIKVNGEVADDIAAVMTGETEIILSKGKNGFARIRFGGSTPKPPLKGLVP